MSWGVLECPGVIRCTGLYPHPSIGQISVKNAFCGTVNIMRGTYFRPIFSRFWRGKIKGRHLINHFNGRS